MNKSNALKAVGIAVLVLAIGTAVYYSFGRTNRSQFCFDFARGMQFGDRKVEKPVNQGTVVGKMTYYLPEVPALQTALAREGFYIDPFEQTGGKIYAAAFFGPSTRSAVLSFQKKHGIEQTGTVDDATLERLGSLYSCPKDAATTTPQKFTVSTTTIGTPTGK